MADTPRSLSQLLSDAADGQASGSYTLQRLRNLIVTIPAFQFNPLRFGKGISDGGSFGDGYSHPASSNGYANLTALQVDFSFATATSNDLAGLMIQAAINAAHAAGGGTVSLRAGKYYVPPFGISFPAYTNARLVGDAGAILMGSPATTASSPCITINACENALAPIESIQLWGFDNKSGGSVPGTGAPNTGIYTAGSVAVFYKLCNSVTVRNVQFFNWDKTADYDVTPGGSYMICWRDCIYALNNKAGVIDSPYANNSFERMSFDKCDFGSNNYSGWVNYAQGSSLGSGTALAADCMFFNCSFDYSCVAHIWYNGGGSSDDLLSSVYCFGCHFETNSSTTGTNARITHDGAMTFFGCEFLENGGNWSGSYLTTASYAASTVVIGCKTPGYTSGSSYIPMINQTFLENASGFGLIGRRGDTAIFSQNTLGNYNAHTRQSPTGYGLSSSLTLMWSLPINVVMPISANMTVTVPNDAATNFAINSTFMFAAMPGVTGTFAGAGGVTVTSSGAGLTFGGSSTAAKQVFLTKTAANTWTAYGSMN